MTIENTYIVDRNLKTVVDQLEDVKELLSSGGGGGGSIPIASTDTLGGVKVGNGLSITEQGVLSASGGIHIVEIEVNDGVYRSTETFAEIAEAFESMPVFLKYSEESPGHAKYICDPAYLRIYSGDYTSYNVETQQLVLSCSSLDDYPEYYAD